MRPRISRGFFLYFLILLQGAPAISQQYKFYYSNSLKILKSNNDTLRLPFLGGMNAPQFSNIDFNHDGVQDLFVFDRAANKVLVFVYRDGKFVNAPELEGRFPYLTDWCLLRENDGDGKPDIFTEVTLDRREFFDTVNRVFTRGGLRIFKNTSTLSGGTSFKLLGNQVMDTGGVFIDFGGLFKDPEKISINTTDMPGIGDLDNDGDDDIIAFKDVELSPHYFENYMKNKHNLPYHPDSTRFILRDDCWGYMEYDRTFSRNIFDLHLTQAERPGCFYTMYEKSGHAANTMFMIDYNGDGIKDIVCGDGSYKNLVLLVNGKNSLGRDSILYQDTAFPSNTKPAQFIGFPAGYYVDVNGDGANDLLVTTNDYVGAKSVNNVWTYDNTGTTDKPVLNYKGPDFFAYSESIDLGTRTVPVLADMDGDGDQDLLIATNGDFEYTNNLNDRIVMYTNRGHVNGRAVFALSDTNFLFLSKDTPIILMHPAMADLNGDNKPDMLIGNSNGNLLYYENKSIGTNYSFQLITRQFFNIDAGSNAAPTLADMDNDGVTDLVIGNKAGYLKFYKNKGTVLLPSFDSKPTIDSFGGVQVNDGYIDFTGVKVTDLDGNASPFAIDLDNDGKKELLVGSWKGKVFLYTDVNTSPGHQFTKLENYLVDYSHGENGNALRFGNWSAPCAGSLDEDNKPDLLIGNLLGGLNFYSSKSAYVPLYGGIDKMQGVKSIFSLYPNPATTSLSLRYPDLNEDGYYSAYNQMGQFVSEGKINRFHSETSIDLSSMLPGVYYIRMFTQNYSETLRFIVMK